MKGVSYCVIRRKLEPLDRVLGQILRGHRSARFPLSSGCCFIEFDTYNLPCVSVYFWLISIARFVFKSSSICF